jgi:hypothetical protein
VRRQLNRFVMAVPTGKVKEVSAMLKAIHAQEDAEAAKEKGSVVIPLPVEFHDVYHDMVTLSSSISGALASFEL